MEDGGVWKMGKAVDVVEMPMGKEDGFDLLGADVHFRELAVDLVIAGEIEFVEDVEVPMGPVGAFAGIDEEDAVGVVDGEDPDGLPSPGQAAGDATGREQVEVYRQAVGGQRTPSVSKADSAPFIIFYNLLIFMDLWLRHFYGG